jgi:spoIIIJ-associated protein
MNENNIIVTGKTVEEAYENARLKLGVDTLDGYECKILDLGKKGIFGIGNTPAKVQVILPEAEQEEDDVALGFVKMLLRDLELDAVAEMSEGEEGIKRISISGSDAGVLIGHHGETLDAFQYLTNLAANRKVEKGDGDRSRITVDVENYRAKREETLRALARRMAAKAKKYNRSVVLEPMNPYERRIIHSEIQNIDGVSTNSVGSDNTRKVVIYLTDKKQNKTEE